MQSLRYEMKCFKNRTREIHFSCFVGIVHPLDRVVLGYHSTFLEIHFTKLPKLAKLTYVRLSVFYIKAHQYVLCKLYTREEFVQ